MSDTWPIVKLGEVVRLRKEFLTIDDLKTYRRPRVQLHAQGIVLRDEVPGALIKTKKQQACRAGELLVAEIDAKVGGFGIVPDHLDGAIVSSHYFLFSVEEEMLNESFLGYFIRTRRFCDQVEAQGSTNYAAIRPADVLGYQIPLPPLPEQRRLVAWIEEMAATVAEARTNRQEARDHARLLWANGAGSLIDPLAGGHPVAPLHELVRVRGGGTPSKTDPVYWDGSIPWITPKDMKVRELHGSRDHISLRATRETAAKLIDPGAVLVVVRGMILAHTFPSAVLRTRAAINQDMKALIPNESLVPEFLCALLWAWNDRILAKVERSTHDTRRLDLAKLLETLVPVPPVSEQRLLLQHLDALNDEVELVRRLQASTAMELDGLLPAVLDRAFRGEP